MNVTKIFLQLLLITLFPILAFSQNEIEREQISLQGLQQFGFTANVEGSMNIADSEQLTPSVIRQQAVNQLLEADLQYVSDEEVQSSADIPFLYMHINTMELENGLIPFSIELRLYQPVKLVLNRGLETSASTWETGMVGMVSYDQLTTIKDAAQQIIDEFIDDYYQSNQNQRAVR